MTSGGSWRRRLERACRSFSRARRGGLGTDADLAAILIARADVERDQGSHRAAAVLYQEALRLRPHDAAIHVQCAHMFKEAGDLAEAGVHYLRALELAPDDADLALQLGHFYKVAGQSGPSQASYRRALALRPGWEDPLRELTALAGGPAGALADDPSAQVDASRLAPELFPSPDGGNGRTRFDGIHLTHAGSRTQRTQWGLASTLSGVEAVRGYCISSAPVERVELALNGATLCSEPLLPGRLDAVRGRARKYVFNVWFDVSAQEPGPARLEIRILGQDGVVLTRGENLVVAAPLKEADHPDSDGVVTLAEGDTRPVEVQVNAKPSVVRPARRSVLPKPIRNILVLRTDQLGDVVVSVPALRRLRELAPEARIVGLFTAANADLARTLGVLDEVIVVDFPDDPRERRRIMPPQAQAALRARLQPYGFDIAIDLAESAVSRPLLVLSGAPFLYGFHDRDWPWLTGGFDGATHDARNGREIAPQSTRVLALIERLGATLNSRAEVIRRTDLSRDALAQFGIGEADRYLLLHTGARIGFSRWPGYGELAQRLLARTGLKVVLMSEAPGEPPPAAGDRLVCIEGRLDFDTFDTLVSHAEVFVGNDSGPKHLAALRGVEVVSIHSARLNWSEWGQELTGSIISRRVPCAGCALFHDDDECAKGFACVNNIRVEEVLSAVEAVLDTRDSQGLASRSLSNSDLII